MDPPSDSPPLPAPQSPFGYISAAAAANPSPAQPPLHSHPPYAEMITAAISALKERDGSSRRAIDKYIGTHYSNLPPTHSSLLRVHLNRLKLFGQLVMVKHSYKLPRSAVNGSIDAVSCDPSSAGSKKRPGRPPKAKPDAVPAVVPVFAPSLDMDSLTDVVPPSNVAAGAVNGPPQSGGVRRRGRPKKNATAAVGGGVAPVAGKRRGRPPNTGGEAEKPRIVATGEPKKPRRFSGKPPGRPKKTETGSQDSQLLFAYLDLKAKLENLQSRVVETATLVKPYLDSEAASNAMQELEGAAVNTQRQQLPVADLGQS